MQNADGELRNKQKEPDPVWIDHELLILDQQDIPEETSDTQPKKEDNQNEDRNRKVK